MADDHILLSAVFLCEDRTRNLHGKHAVVSTPAPLSLSELPLVSKRAAVGMHPSAARPSHAPFCCSLLAPTEQTGL